MAAEPNKSIAQKQARYGATAALYVIVVIAILLLANWLAGRYNKSYDTTRNKRYTLSQQTQKIVKGLKQDATITYFDRGPDQFKQAQGILDRYANVSRKVHVQYVSLIKDPVLAMAYGVRTPGTAFVTVGQRREEARALTEEGITTAFVKVLKGARKVCFVKGSGEDEVNGRGSSSLSQFKTLLDKDNYTSDTITLYDKTEVPSDCRVLIAAGPKSDYTPNEISAIRKYVEKGGGLLVGIDAPIDIQKEHISENKPLRDLLASWGVTVDKDLVLEQNPGALTADVGPVFPLILNYESHPITDDLKAISGFLLTQSMQVKNAAKTSVQKLAVTTDSAVATSKLDSPKIDMKDASNQHGTFTVAAAGTFNTGQPSKQGRFVVLGTSRLLDNAETGIHFQSNRDFALNSVNWLAADEDLISIRPKESEDQRLDMTQSKANMFTYVVEFALPLLIIVIGVSILWKRR